MDYRYGSTLKSVLNHVYDLLIILMNYWYDLYKYGLKGYVCEWDISMALHDFGSTELSVWEYVPYWNMRVACYDFVARATSRVPYSVILMGNRRCVLHLRAGATSRVPILVCLPFGGIS